MSIKSPKIIALLILILFTCAGCQTMSWETFGIASSESVNKHIGEASENHKKDLNNQTKIANVTAKLAGEVKYLSKKNDDDKAVERAITIEVEAKNAAKEADALSEVKWSSIPEPTMDFTGLLSMIMGILGGVGVPGMGVGMMILNKAKNSQLTREKKKAKRYAKSTQVDEYEED